MPETMPPALELNVDSLPSPPHVAMKVIELCDDPDTGINDLCKVLQLDSALSASLLRIANSTAYSRGRIFSSVQQAVSVLGTKATSAIALGVAIKEAIPQWSHPNGLCDVVLWRHSIGTAVFARDLARLVGYPDQQQAFLCGLLSRIGQLILYKVLPESYGRVLDESPSLLPSPELEQQHCGMPHYVVGRQLLEKWHLPQEICEVVGAWPLAGNDQPYTSDNAKLLSANIRIADSLSSLFVADDDGVQLHDAHRLALELQGISSGEVERLFTSSEAQYLETLAVFGDTDRVVDCGAILQAAQRSLAMMSLRLAEDLVDATQNAQSLEEQNRTLKKSAATDALTGLPNRAALSVESAEVWKALQSGTRHFSVLMIDVDYFKKFNDSYGHKVGDAVLIAVAQSLAETARSTDFVARYGGEEFTVILTNAASDHGTSIAERFRKGIESMVVQHDGKTFNVTASFGLACSDKVKDASSFDDIIEAADRALYAAKRAGRNQVALAHATAAETAPQ